MVIVDFYKIPVAISLGVVIGVLIFSVLASWLWPPTEIPTPEPAPAVLEE
jgi:hypothetical protein